MGSLYHRTAVALLLSACCGVLPASAETTPAQPPAGPPGETAAQSGAAPAASLTPSQLLGGVHRLGDETIAALVRLAQDAELVQELARDPAQLEVGAALPAELRAAAAVLARTPEVVVAAAAMPEALTALRELYTELPAGAAARVEELRRGYARAEREASQRWQALLESDATAQRAYAEWLTRFSNAQRALNPRFPCVQVMSPGYYGALPPDDAFIAYVLSTGRPPEALDRVLREFWREHAPALRDQRVQQRIWGEAPPAPARFIAGLAPAERRGMFKPTDQPDPAAIGLAPALLQPKEDQAPEVQRIAAVTEISRLWSEPLRDASSPVAADTQPSPAPGGGANIPAGPRAATTPVSVAGGGAPRVPDFAAPQYALGGVSLSSGAYWGVFPYYTYYGRPYSIYHGAAYWPTSRDCDQRYFINYGYPYGNRGGFIDGRYVPPCSPVDLGPRGGSAARLPTERFSPTGVGVIRHYPSALNAVGGVRRSSASINRLTTPTYRLGPANRGATSRTGRSDATSASRPRAMATPAVGHPQPRPAATNWRAAPGRPPGSVDLRSGRSTSGAGRSTAAGGTRNVRPAPPQRLAGQPR